MPKESQIFQRKLNETKVPHILSSRNIALELATHEAAISTQEKEHFNKIIQVLHHPALLDRTRKGEFTIGIIKPKAFQARNVPDTDEEATETLLEEARKAFTMEDDGTGILKKNKNRDVIFSLSLQMTKEQAEDFYALNKDNFKSVVINETTGETLWDKVTTFMSSSPSTFILLRDKTGYAPEAWRSVIGSTKPNPKEQTLRGKFAKSLNNNLYHGSANTIEAVREVQVVADILGEYYQQLPTINESHYPVIKEAQQRRRNFRKEQVIYVTDEYAAKKRKQEPIFTGNKVVFVNKNQNIDEEFVRAEELRAA